MAPTHRWHPNTLVGTRFQPGSSDALSMHAQGGRVVMVVVVVAVRVVVVVVVAVVVVVRVVFELVVSVVLV